MRRDEGVCGRILVLNRRQWRVLGAKDKESKQRIRSEEIDLAGRGSQRLYRLRRKKERWALGEADASRPPMSETGATRWQKRPK